MDESDDFFAQFITLEMMNVMPAIIRNQSCSHDGCKLLLILNPIPFLILAIGGEQQHWALYVSGLAEDACIAQHLFGFVDTADIERIPFLEELVLPDFVLCQRKVIECAQKRRKLQLSYDAHQANGLAEILLCPNTEG